MFPTPVILSGIVLLLFLNLFTLWLYLRQQKFFKQFTSTISKADLKKVLAQITTDITVMQKQAVDQEHAIKALSVAGQTHFQKIGFVRFNPFSDTGGDQSFCLCLLDAHHNGVAVTSLHNREQTRIYAKLIQDGQSEHTFFEEEKQALKLALESSS